MKWNIFKRSNNEVIEKPYEYPVESATSLIFSGYRLDDVATSLSAFFAAKELISNSIAQLPILIKRKGAIDEKHPLNFIFRNTLINKFNFIKQLIDDIIMHGEAFAYIVRANDGTPTSLIYCEYGKCIQHYVQSRQELYYTIPFIRRGKIEPIDVIHLYKNSFNGVEGKSLVGYANNVLKLAQATDKTARKYYTNGCAIQGALTIKGGRRGAKEDARNAFKKTHGDEGSGLVILDDDMSYQPMSSNANDSQMLEAREFNIDEIARYFNINPVLLGDLSHTSYNTIEAANIDLVSHTLMPYIAILEDEFNRKLIKPSEYGKISIDFDETYILNGDKTANANYYKSLVSGGIMTINEARKALGLCEKENADDLIMSFTNINDNKVNGNEEESKENKENNKKIVEETEENE